MIRTIVFSVLCGVLLGLPLAAPLADFWSQSLSATAPFKNPGVLRDLERYADRRFGRLRSPSFHISGALPRNLL